MAFDTKRGLGGALKGGLIGGSFGPEGILPGLLGGGLFGGLGRNRRPDNWDHNIKHGGVTDYGIGGTDAWDQYGDQYRGLRPGDEGYAMSFEDYVAMQGQPQDPMRKAGGGQSIGAAHAALAGSPWDQPQDPTSLQDPSAGERFFEGNKDWFTSPTAAGDYWEGVAGKFNAPGGGRNRAGEWYDKFLGDHPRDAGVSGFYDEGKRRTTEDLNNQLAARGLFGSSEGVGMLGEALTGLEAQRARDEADYRMQTSALGGQLARGGDLSELGMRGMDLDYLLGGANVARAADASELGRMGLGGNLALGAGAAEETRLGNMLDRTMGYGADTRDFLMGGYERGMAQDERLFGDMLEAILGRYGFDYSASERETEKGKQSIGMIADIFSSIMPMMGGG